MGFYLRFLILTGSILLTLSCNKKEEVPVQRTENYLHISHTRTNQNYEIDSVAQSIDYSKYELLLLGGDLLNLTSLNDSTMDIGNTIFDFGSETTLWALGNHDYTDLQRVQGYTNREAYYAYFKNGITYLVLDTQDSLSNIIGQQKLLVDQVIDTISESSHLILIHHKLIWMYGDPFLESQIDQVSNGHLGDCFYCINENNFYLDIYPKLVEVKNAGIEVVCIGGDLGFNAKSFEYQTEEGINFLASGISFLDQDKKGILFTHDLVEKSLNWEFKSLNDL